MFSTSHFADAFQKLKCSNSRMYSNYKEIPKTIQVIAIAHVCASKWKQLLRLGQGGLAASQVLNSSLTYGGVPG